jgi:hypothetical protein
MLLPPGDYDAQRRSSFAAIGILLMGQGAYYPKARSFMSKVDERYDIDIVRNAFNDLVEDRAELILKDLKKLMAAAGSKPVRKR